jgi:hypothetical protein
MLEAFLLEVQVGVIELPKFCENPY